MLLACFRKRMSVQEEEGLREAADQGEEEEVESAVGEVRTKLHY